MESLAVFNFQSNTVRTITDEKGELWLVANDVCNILGYTNPSKTIKDHCKIGGITKRYTPTESGEQEMVYINEPNLYRLIIKSRKPEAEAFESWVMENVLPTIRKTGSYSDKITSEQAGVLATIVRTRTEGNGKLAPQMWSRLKNHFKYAASYRELIAIHFDDAVAYLECMELKGELSAPQNTSTAFDLLAIDTTNKVMDYYWSLHAEIKRLGGKSPESPKFDEETIARACITRMVDQSRMLLSFNGRTGEPQVQFIPSNSWILTSENIAGIIADPQGVEKRLLPDIINAATQRLAALFKK